ncbi:molecular chaperone TorD family protein [Neobacillus pocheonensis]|uniref:TorD/DmsD family molecular chaperone n=1 Tax=Neobacillus pocheonensis TaxID=363869 RepID=UPI003D285797
MTKTESLQIQLLPFLLLRKNFYQMIYLLFSEPNMEVFEQIQSNGNLQEIKEIHEGGKILAAFFEHLSCSQYNKVQEEFQRLFIGPGPLVAPPWESFYRSKEQLLFEEWNDQVREQFHQFGLKSIKENNEPDDHLLLELEFMIFLLDLCLQETETAIIAELLITQVRFLSEHLTVWIPYFCERVIQNTTSQLYLGAALLLEDFLHFDLQTISELKEVVAHV